MTKRHDIIRELLDCSRLDLGDGIEAVPAAAHEYHVRPSDNAGEDLVANVRVTPTGDAWYTGGHPSRLFTGSPKRAEERTPRAWLVQYRLRARWTSGVTLQVSKREALMEGYSAWMEAMSD